MPVKLNSTGGGSVTLTVPSTASDFTQSLPAGNGTILTTAGVTTPVEFAAGTAALPSITTTGDTNTGLYFPAADTVATTTGGTERMRVDSSGNVGIGTSSPNAAYRLDVSGTGRFTTGVVVTGGNALQFIESTGNNSWYFNNNSNNLTFTYNTSERMRIDNSGNVGIGTSAPGVKLDVNGVIRSTGTSAILSVSKRSTGTGDAWGMYSQSGELNLYDYIAAVSRMVIDTSGNVGIGTSSPTNKLSVNGSMNASNYYMQDSSAAAAGTYGFANSNGPFIQTWGNSSAQTGAMLFATSGSERARITSGGDLLVGTSSTLFASSHAFVNSGQAVLGLRNSGSTAGKYWQLGPDGGNSFKVYNQSSVGMFMSDGSTSWSSSSDERQKNIIEPISNAVAKVNSLRAVIGSYKSDQENKRRSFLIAQDVEKALPEAVTTAPDGFLGVAYTDVIPLLVAAIKEQQTQIATLEARLTALEAK